jgi:hypothetical protein
MTDDEKIIIAGSCGLSVSSKLGEELQFLGTESEWKDYQNALYEETADYLFKKQK